MQITKPLHNHIYRSHTGHNAKHLVEHPIRVQRLYTGGNRVCFRTQPAAAAIFGSDPFTTFLGSLPALAKSESTPIIGQEPEGLARNRRDELPFIRKPDWQSLVLSNRPGDLIGLVGGPKGTQRKHEPELERCRQGIQTYLGSFRDVIGQSKNLPIVQRINSNDAEM